MGITIIIAFATKGCNLCSTALQHDYDAAKTMPQLVHCMPALSLAQLQHLLRSRIGSNIVISGLTAQEQITYRTTHNISFKAGMIESLQYAFCIGWQLCH